MTRRLVLLVAALAGLGLVAAPGANAGERVAARNPRVLCADWGALGLCIDNPLRSLPELP